MKPWLKYGIAGLIAAAIVIPLAKSAPRTDSAAAQFPTPTASPSTANNLSGAKPFKMRLSLSSPDDLRVREGDRIREGQLLADKTRDRQRLEAQKQQLNLQIQKLSQPVPDPPALRQIPQVSALPGATFIEQIADIDRAKLKVLEATRNKEQQQRKLDLLQTLSQSELPQATIPHETEKLKQRQQELDQANAEVSLSEARLSKAQKDREHEEYLHSLEMSKREMSLQQQELQRSEQLQRKQEQERDRNFQLAQLQNQLQALENQLVQLSAIRSPYSGTIQRIKFEGQNDQSLMVELTLSLRSNTRRSQPPAVITPDSTD